MNDEKLIHLVKTNVELYDVTHHKYADFNYKEQIWGHIAEQLKQSISACKTRWNNIRDNYRKVLKKRVTKPGTNSRPYKFESQLLFLSPFFQEKCLIGSVAFEDTFLHSQPEEGDNFTKCDPATFIDTNVENFRSEESEDNDDHLDSKPRQSKRWRPAASTPAVKRRRKMAETTPVKLRKLLLAEKKRKMNYQPMHPVDGFLSSLAPTLKTFSPIRLNLIKSKIFSAVQETEMAMFLEQQNKTAQRTSEAREASISSSPDSDAPSPLERCVSPSLLPLYNDFLKQHVH